MVFVFKAVFSKRLIAFIVIMQKGFAEDVKCRVQLVEPDRKCWERICRNFLKAR